jgi:anti-sigma factor RsiW
MNCEEARPWLTAYLDDELDAAGTVGIEKHLAECPDCRRVHEEGLALRSAIRGAGLYYDPPAGLARKVRPTVRPSMSWPNWTWAAVGAVAAALVMGLVMRTDPQNRIAEDVLASHVRSLQAGHLVDVESTDKHTVKPWFQGKLDFSPPVPDMAELVGGRLDYVNGRPVAALVYKRREHRINVFVWPENGSEAPSTQTLQGYQIVHWNEHGMAWWAVSDMGDLAEFGKQLETSDKPQ